jgi:hypothetical protein
MINVQCNLFEKEGQSCAASIETSYWKVDEATRQKYCETDNFRDCPRYKVFRDHEDASSIIRTLRGLKPK